MDVNIPVAVAIVVSYLFGLWVGYGEGKRKVMDAWEEWADKCLGRFGRDAQKKEREVME